MNEMNDMSPPPRVEILEEKKEVKAIDIAENERLMALQSSEFDKMAEEAALRMEDAILAQEDARHLDELSIGEIEDALEKAADTKRDAEVEKSKLETEGKKQSEELRVKEMQVDKADNELTAKAFIEKHDKLDGMTKKEKEEHFDRILNGSHMSKSVETMTIKKGEVICQFEKHNSDNKETPNGCWFAKPGESAENVGISGESDQSQDRKMDFFVANEDVEVLKSTAKDVSSWYRSDESGKASGELLHGGSEQYYIGQDQRDKLRRIVN